MAKLRRIVRVLLWLELVRLLMLLENKREGSWKIDLI